MTFLVLDESRLKNVQNFSNYFSHTLVAINWKSPFVDGGWLVGLPGSEFGMCFRLGRVSNPPIRKSPNVLFEVTPGYHNHNRFLFKWNMKNAATNWIFCPFQPYYANNTMGGSPETVAGPTEPGGAPECRLFAAITTAGAATAAHTGPTTRWEWNVQVRF